MLKIKTSILQALQQKAKDNPVCIIRSYENTMFDVVFKHMRYNDIIVSCVSFEDAQELVLKINQEEIE